MNNRFWSPVVHRLTPYVPGEQPKLSNLVKLNTNENPYEPSPRVLDAIRAELSDALRLYPDPNAERLKQAIADYYGVTPAQVFVGNGSDEVLAHVFQALFQHPAPLLFPDITYSFYPVYCGLYGIDFATLPLAEDFTLRVADYLRPNGGIIFANPNAPTGCLLPLADIAWLLERNRDSVVAVDEAYIDFGGDTAIALVNRYPNLLVTQTLSKSRSLAGLRVGLAVGHPELIEALERVKNSFNSYPLDRLAIAGAVAAFEDVNISNALARRSSPAACNWLRPCRTSASRFCRPPPTSFSPAIRSGTLLHWLPPCGNAASSSATSASRASTSSCASPSAIRRRTLRCWPRSPKFWRNAERCNSLNWWPIPTAC